MRQFRLLASVGLVALFLSLLALFPARNALGMLGVPAETASGVTGTIWNGSVQRLALDGITLGPVSWRARPGSLLLGRLAAHIEARLPDGFANATAGLSVAGTLFLHDLEGTGPVAWLAPSAGGDTGQLVARFERLEFRDGRVTTAIGTLQAAAVVLPLPAGSSQLAPGNYTISFDARDIDPEAPLTGTLTDAGGPLEIAGTVTFTPPRAYELSATARARPEAPPELRSALQMLGPAGPGGAHALSLAGSF